MHTVRHCSVNVLIYCFPEVDSDVAIRRYEHVYSPSRQKYTKKLNNKQCTKYKKEKKKKQSITQ